MTNAEESKVTAQAIQASAVSMEKVIELLLRRDARDLLKQQEDLDRQAAQQAQLERNAKEENIKFLFKQTTCNHLKGGNKKGAKLRQTTDYNVYRHTFIDGTSYIKCMSCRAKWIPEDTTQYLFRGGTQILNHTKMGWHEAIMLTNQSSNKESSSEIPGQIIATSMAAKIQTAGSAAGVASLLPVDKEGKAVPNVSY